MRRPGVQVGDLDAVSTRGALRTKTFEAPDEMRTVPSALLRVVNLGEVAVGHAIWQPGWRWSTDLRPIAGTEWCENHHLGNAVSGRRTAAASSDAAGDHYVNGAVANRTENCLHQMTTLPATGTSTPAGTA